MTEISSPLADSLARGRPGENAVVALSSGRRVRGQCATFVERGHPRRVYLVEELTEELRRTEMSAYEKLIRMMSHEVNNTVGAPRSLLQSTRAYAGELPGPHRAELEEALGVADGSLERLSGFMRAFADVVRMPPPTKRLSDPLRLLQDCVRLVQAQSDPALVRWVWAQGPAPSSRPPRRRIGTQVVLHS